MSWDFIRIPVIAVLLCGFAAALSGLQQTPVRSASESALELEQHAGSLSKSNRPQDREAAVAAYGKSLALLKTNGDRAGQARVQVGLGQLSDRSGKWHQALDHFTAALDVLGRGGDPRIYATALYGAGKAKAALHQTPEALAAFEEALALRRSTGDLFEQALILHNMAAAQWAVADNSAALQNYRQALALREQLGDKPGLAYTHYGIAMVHWSSGERQFALDACELSRKQWAELGNHFGLANTANSMGLLYAELGDLDRARDNYTEALRLWRRLNHPVMAAYTTNNLGMANAAVRDLAAAARHYASALAALRHAGDRRGIAYVLHNQGDLARLRNQPEEAVKLYQASLDIKREIGDRFGEAITMERLADAQRSAGNLRSAEEGFQTALSRHREIGNLSGQMMALWGLARVRLAQPDLDAAFRCFQEAIALSEEMRGAISNADLRVTYFTTVQDLYHEAIKAAATKYRDTGDQQWAEAAFLLSERSRARVLLDALAGPRPHSKTALSSGASGSPISAFRLLAGRMRAASQRMQRLASSPGNHAELARAHSQMQRLVREWRDATAASTPRESTGRWWPSTNLLAQVRSSALAPDTWLLVFRVGETESFSWTVSSGAMEMHTLPGRAALERIARRYLNLVRAREPEEADTELAARHHRIQQADTNLDEAALKLSWLLLAKSLRNCPATHLVVVPDGILHAVPFAALPQPYHPRQPLISRWGVSRTPSAAALVLLSQRPSLLPEDRIAVIADPVYGSNDTRLSGKPMASVVGLSRAGTSPPSASPLPVPALPRLRFTRQEAAAIRSAAGIPVEVFDGFRATPELFASPVLRNARIVHFGGHAWVDSHTPAASGLALSLFGPDGQPRDGYLRLFDLYETSLSAELVVLGGCRTALGRTWEGEGIDGLVRGFLHAGASRVVATLWTVNDAATAELLKSFYHHHLSRRKPAAAALRAAQRELAASQHFAHPYYWAAFVLVGDWH